MFGGPKGFQAYDASVLSSSASVLGFRGVVARPLLLISPRLASLTILPRLGSLGLKAASAVPMERERSVAN